MSESVREEVEAIRAREARPGSTRRAPMDDVARAEEALVEARTALNLAAANVVRYHEPNRYWVRCCGCGWIVPSGSHKHARWLFQDHVGEMVVEALVAVTVETTCETCGGTGLDNSIPEQGRCSCGRFVDDDVPCPDCSNGTVFRSALAVLMGEEE